MLDNHALLHGLWGNEMFRSLAGALALTALSSSLALSEQCVSDTGAICVGPPVKELMPSFEKTYQRVRFENGCDAQVTVYVAKRTSRKTLEMPVTIAAYGTGTDFCKIGECSWGDYRSVCGKKSAPSASRQRTASARSVQPQAVKPPPSTGPGSLADKGWTEATQTSSFHGTWVGTVTWGMFTDSVDMKVNVQGKRVTGSWESKGDVYQINSTINGNSFTFAWTDPLGFRNTGTLTLTGPGTAAIDFAGAFKGTVRRQ